jgi:dienelactone hydrolase
VTRAAGLGALVLLLAAAGPSAARAPTPTGTWTGTFSVPRGGQAVAITVELRSSSAVVSAADGHPVQTVVAARRSPGRLRFALPGRPSAMVFDGGLSGRSIRGSVRQGAVRGTFELRRGPGAELGAPGLYALDGGRHLVVADGAFGRNAILLDAGELHLLTRSGRGRYAIGAGLGDATPAGTASFERGGAMWSPSDGRSERAARVAWRQEEVRVRSGDATLGCTLTIPPGSGPRPAVAFAHGSGPAYRYYVQTWASFFATAGMVTLACDKRGIGQSSGLYPGEAASERNIDRYARDAEAQARFLAAQPEVDDARIGLSGASQAGWIMPLAASREPAIRWLVLLVSPTVTQGESDLWGDLTGQGDSPPSQSAAAMEAEIRRAGPNGFDPLPAIRSLRVPALWLFGALDMHVPTRLSVERLDPVAREPGRDLSYVVFPRGAHHLIDTSTGLNSDLARSRRYVEGLFPTIRAWLDARRISAG